jgi:hypothetical protein
MNKIRIKVMKARSLVVLGCHPPANEKAGKYLIPNGKRKADLA